MSKEMDIRRILGQANSGIRIATRAFDWHRHLKVGNGNRGQAEIANKTAKFVIANLNRYGVGNAGGSAIGVARKGSQRARTWISGEVTDVDLDRSALELLLIDHGGYVSFHVIQNVPA